MDAERLTGRSQACLALFLFGRYIFNLTSPYYRTPFSSLPPNGKVSAMSSRLLQTLVALGTLAIAATAIAEDNAYYYKVLLDDLKLADGARPPARETFRWQSWQRSRVMTPYVVLDGPGEAYVQLGGWWAAPWSEQARREDRSSLCIRTEGKRDLAGRLFFPKSDWSGMEIFKFTIPAKEAGTDTKTRETFYFAKWDHYNDLLRRGVPGAAWFRHDLRQSELAWRGEHAENRAQEQPFRRASFNRLQDTYDLFTGGRALSENLQLDRTVRQTKQDAATVEVDKIEGITIQ
jgi:hypothetical protein